MQFFRLKDALKEFTVFSLRDIRRIDSNFHRRRLNEWQEKGLIKKVVRNYYIFSDLEINENVLFEIANRIYAPSYVSFEMALSYYHLIPESVYAITSASSRRTYNFKTPLAQFNYRKIKTELFWGYNIVKYNNKSFKIACMEKAILDYFYINAQIKTEYDFSTLRINKGLFLSNVNEKQFYSFSDRFSQKSLTGRINLFMEYIKNA